MELNELLVELFQRIDEHVHEAVDGLDVDALTTPPAPGANPIGWLVWHLARGQDDQIAEILEQEQVWISGDWARRFGVAADPANTGYGHSEDDVIAIRPESAEALIEYYEAVANRTH
ncbi:MAG: DinB family protein, partial [Actinomycetota bacterium]|nr:DinB family protein [Actinomycetota bacterium]